MKKKNSETYKFVSFDAFIQKHLKSEKFRTAFYEEMSRMRLARDIKALRQKQRLTQKQVAEKADMPQSVVARMESGTHSFSLTTLVKIAGVFKKQVGLVG